MDVAEFVGTQHTLRFVSSQENLGERLGHRGRLAGEPVERVTAKTLFELAHLERLRSSDREWRCARAGPQR
jgi:hypothetical protein